MCDICMRLSDYWQIISNIDVNTSTAIFFIKKQRVEILFPSIVCISSASDWETWAKKAEGACQANSFLAFMIVWKVSAH